MDLWIWALNQWMEEFSLIDDGRALSLTRKNVVPKSERQPLVVSKSVITPGGQVRFAVIIPFAGCVRTSDKRRRVRPSMNTSCWVCKTASTFDIEVPEQCWATSLSSMSGMTQQVTPSITSKAPSESPFWRLVAPF
jgi:hypothetical protein